MDYDRAVAESDISSSSPVEGNNPDENTAIIADELKKSCIEFMTTQNFDTFGSVEMDQSEGIPEVHDFTRAITQGKYAEFFEKAFEWENLQYLLYSYFWGRKSGWRNHMALRSADPKFAAFLKAGAALLTIPARLGFSMEVIHFLETGKTWKEGPVSELAGYKYYSVAQEILAAKAHPGVEVAVGDPWYTVTPTDLVRLRAESERPLPEFEFDKATGVWVEVQPKVEQPTQPEEQ